MIAPLEAVPYVVSLLSLGSVSLFRSFLLPSSQDYPTIRFNSQESVEMPFRMRFTVFLECLLTCYGVGYMRTAEGEPVLPPGMKQLLKDDLDKGFDLE